MPQVGFVCEVDETEVSFDACRTCAKDGGKKIENTVCHYTEVIDQLATANEHRKGLGISVTMLTSCTRRSYLERKADWYVKPSQQYWSWRGQLVHLLLEGTDRRDAIRERRYEREVPEHGVRLSGQVDLLYPARKLLVDYKTIRKLPNEPKDGHVLQLNIYRWLLAKGREYGNQVPVEIEVDNLGLMYFDMSGVRKFRAPLMDLDEIQDFVVQKTGEIQTAIQTDGQVLPPVLPKAERWLCRGYCNVKHLCEKAEGKPVSKWD